MKLFVFGAGASYDYLGTEDQNPYVKDRPRPAPLVKHLFDVEGLDENSMVSDERRTLTDLRGVLSEEDREEYRTDGEKRGVEEFLTEKWEATEKLRDEDNKESKLASFGRVAFYLWWRFQVVSSAYRPRNAYEVLLKKLDTKDEPFGLITFDYDTLLDQALIKIRGVNLVSLKTYRENRLVKLHGSVNWFVRKETDESPPPSFAEDHATWARQAANFMFRGGDFDLSRTRAIDPTEEQLKNVGALRKHPLFRDHYFYPLVLIPLTTKLYPRVKGHQPDLVQAARDLLKVSSDIYVIGYRGKDELFQDLIESTSRTMQVHVVGSKEGAGKTMDHLLSLNRQLKKGAIYSDGFYSFAQDYTP